MEIARGVDLAIMIASFVFSFVFGWMYFREHQRYYLFWALGCILFGARYPFFWQMVGQDAVSPFILSLSFSMIFVGFFLLNNGLWKYIGFKYIPWANILAAVVYMALLSMLFFEDAFSLVSISDLHIYAAGVSARSPASSFSCCPAATAHCIGGSLGCS